MVAPGSRGLFVTGTDTGVGKTVVAAGIVSLLRESGVDAVGMKPVETGVAGLARWPDASGRAVPADGAMLRAASLLSCPMEQIVPQAFAEPLAPLVAAERAGTEVDFAAILAAHARLRARHAFVVAEGAGGLAVPVSRDGKDMADIALAFGMPVLVVARPDLGTINHTALTVRYARARGLTVIGIIVNRYPPASEDVAIRTNPEVLARWTGVPVLGRVALADSPVTSPADAAALVRAGSPGLLAALGRL